MPLHPGKSEKVVSKNIQEMQNAGHPHDQAVAAALHTAHPNGGYADGGMVEDVKNYIANLYDKAQKGPVVQDSTLKGLGDMLRGDKPEAAMADAIDPMVTGSTDTAAGYADGGVVDEREFEDPVPGPEQGMDFHADQSGYKHITEYDTAADGGVVDDPGDQPIFDPQSGMPPVAPAPVAPQAPSLPAYIANQKAQIDQYGPEQQQAVTQGILSAQNGVQGRLANAGTGLADALMQGVARAGNPGFQQNLQNRQNSQANMRLEGLKGAREANLQNVEAGSKLDQIDPTSAVSNSKRQAYGPVLQALGYSPERLAKMPASEIDNTLNILQQTHGKELEAAWHQVENQMKSKELGLKGQEIAQTGEKNIEEARHNAAEEQNKGQEIQAGTLEHAAAEPLTSRLALMVGLNPAGKALQKEAIGSNSVAAPAANSGPYGPTVQRGGKTYVWSPLSKMYHPE